jgi:DNA-binding NarL/FixJ family response regulator
VREAASAEEALTLLRAAPVQVIMTDLGLPGVSGADLAARARAERPDVGIVFASGRDERPDVPGAVLLLKPYDAAAIAAALRAVRG